MSTRSICVVDLRQTNRGRGHDILSERFVPLDRIGVRGFAGLRTNDCGRLSDVRRRFGKRRADPGFLRRVASLAAPRLRPPASGPGPVTNGSRVRGVSNYNQLVGDYTNPILNREAAEVMKAHGDLSLKGIGYPTPSNQCWPDGVPYIFWQYGMQMLQEKDKVAILYLQDHQFRQVRLNQPHPAHVTPSWYGDSVGHYEGDTLVIDTVGVSMADMYDTPYSPFAACGGTLQAARLRGRQGPAGIAISFRT
jgi:hypothetical protein